MKRLIPLIILAFTSVVFAYDNCGEYEGCPASGVSVNPTVGGQDDVQSALEYLEGAAIIDPMTTRGDIVIRDATNTTARLGIGGAGTYLSSDGTDVSWATVTGWAMPPNEVLVDPGLPEVAGDRYQSIANALVYVATQTPSTTNRWAVVVSGTNAESFTLPSWVSIVGKYPGTRLTGAIDTAGTVPADPAEFIISDCVLTNVALTAANFLNVINGEVAGCSATGGILSVAKGSISGGTFTSLLVMVVTESAILGGTFLPLSQLQLFHARVQTAAGGAINMTIPTGVSILAYNSFWNGTITINAGGTLTCDALVGPTIANSGTINGMYVDSNNDMKTSGEVVAGDGNTEGFRHNSQLWQYNTAVSAWYSTQPLAVNGVRAYTSNLEFNIAATGASGNITFDQNGAEKMRVHTNGFVGIGNVAPATELDVTGDATISGTVTAASDTDSTHTFGRAKLGSPVTDTAYFAHFDRLSTADYAIKQDAGGETTINSRATRDLNLAIGNALKVVLEADGTFNIENGLKTNITTVNAATYDLLVTDYILNVTYTGTGAVTSLTLPTAQTIEGRVIVIKDAGGNAGTNNITIDTEAAQTIDGAATAVINANYDSVNLYCDGSNWFIY